MNPTPVAPNLPAPRFRWPMRVFLCGLLAWMALRSTSTMYPWRTWCHDLRVQEFPDPLPTRAETAEIKARAIGDHALGQRLVDTAGSVGTYFVPWPCRAAAEQIEGPLDVGKYAVCWIQTRFEFFESVLGINQEWPMFSPNVAREKTVTRSRLVYADGTERIVRQLADPADLTCYAHWFEEKRLDHELKVGPKDHEACLGWCNLLAHRHPTNERGSPLKRIYLFSVRYLLPPPDVDAAAFLAEQTGPPADQVQPDYFRYDVPGRNGQILARE